MTTNVRREEPNGDLFDGLLDETTSLRKYGTLSIKSLGIRYIGDFRDNQPGGVGTIVYPDKIRFEGSHTNFRFEKGELTFDDGERHEGTWYKNCPTKDGLRKFKDGRRSQQGMMVVHKGKNSDQCSVYFVINSGVRVAETWRGTSHGAVREAVGFIPQAALQYEESLIRACSSGNITNVTKVLKQHRILAKYALDTSENKCAPCLVVASANGFVDIVKILLMNGADTDNTDADMHNAFHASAFFAHADVMQVLCELTKSSEAAHFAMNSFSESNETPLQMAVDAYRKSIPGADECVRLLVAAGADPGNLEASIVVADPESILFNTVLFLVPPTTEVLLQNYLRDWHSRHP